MAFCPVSDNSGIIMLKSVNIDRFMRGLVMPDIPIKSNFDDLANAAAVPDPTRPARDWIGSRIRVLCDGISSGQPWARTPGPALFAMTGVCRPYWEGEGYSPPVMEPPFLGGQCDSVRYGATYEWSSNDSGNWSSQNISTFFPLNRELYGPISVIGQLSAGAGSTICGAGSLNKSYELTGKDASGNFRQVGLNLGGVGCRGVQSLQVRNLSFYPIGSAQDCGDPPPVIRPGPTPAPDPGPIDPDERPRDDPESGPILPIPDMPGLPGFPAIPFPNPFASTGDTVPGDPGAPGPSVDITGGDAEGDAPPGSELVALRVDILASPPFRTPLRDGVFQAVCFAYMGTVAGLDQDPGGAYLRDGQLIYAERGGLTKWRVSANVGYSLRITPFYQEVN